MDVSVHNTESVEIGEWEKLSSTDKTTTYTKKITIKSKSFMGDGYESQTITLFKNIINGDSVEDGHSVGYDDLIEYKA